MSNKDFYWKEVNVETRYISERNNKVNVNKNHMNNSEMSKIAIIAVLATGNEEINGDYINCTYTKL